MTPSEFQAWFPDGDFASLSVPYVQRFLDRAAPMLNAARWGKSYSEGLAHCAAHMIVMSKRRAARVAAGGIEQVDSGNIASKAVGPVSVSYNGELVSRQASDTFMLTDYGRRYCELRDMAGIGGGVGTGPDYVESYA